MDARMKNRILELMGEEGHVVVEHIEAKEEGLYAVLGLIEESTGVAGLHLNGEIAEWGDLRAGGFHETWLTKFDEALEA